MKKVFVLLWLTMLSPAVFAEEAPMPGANGWRFEELRRFPAPEARQGVAADRDYLYVISNHELGKYRKATGERVATWSCPEGQPLTHINAGVVYQGRLLGAHSNYPGVPHISSVESWDTSDLRPAGAVSFGRTDGSLTWFDRREGRWLACFVHYTGRGGVPGRGQEWTRLVEYDDDWRPTGRGWVFPPAMLAYLGGNGFSVSGGGIGPGGFLFVTGHDAKALCVLSFPEAGSVLRWEATVPMTAEGQAFAWDPAEPGVIHCVLKRERQVITGRVERVANR